MILYYSPGACSLADHIALHEAGMKFDLAKVDLKTHRLEDGGAYTDINPKGSVPALRFDDGNVLTENVAILSMIADKHSALLPSGEFGRSRLIEMLAFISTEIHKAFKPLFSPDATDAEKKKAAKTIAEKLELVSTLFKGPYVFGATATVADAYLYVMLRWAADNGVAIPDTLADFAEKMQSRPAVQLALKHEKLN